MGFDQTVDIGTDVASFFLFHPDDLEHRQEDPIAWYDYGFACRKEFEAGNLIAFRTGADGGYQLRLTSGDLTDAERKLETGSWEWGYTVRHGKVLVDNGDYLPSVEAFDLEDVSEDQWVSLPDGNYRVTVHPIARKDDSLPDYVIRFETVKEALHIAKSSSPPDLIPLPDRPPRAIEGGSANDIYTKKEDEPLAETYPLLVAEGKYVLPGGSISLSVSDDLFAAVESEDPSLTNEEGYIYVVLASNDAVPGLATMAWVNGFSQLRGESGRLSMRGERMVRITERKEGKLLPTVKVEPVTRPDSSLGTAEIKALQTGFAKYANRHAKDKHSVKSFDQERIAAITDGTALTTRLIELLPLPVETRFRLQGASNIERGQDLIALLESL